jgi:hypothetical protein
MRPSPVLADLEKPFLQLPPVHRAVAIRVEAPEDLLAVRPGQQPLQALQRHELLPGPETTVLGG